MGWVEGAGWVNIIDELIFVVEMDQARKLLAWWRCKRNHLQHYAMETSSAILFSCIYVFFFFWCSFFHLSIDEAYTLYTDAHGEKIGFNLRSGNFTWSNYFRYFLFFLLRSGYVFLIFACTILYVPPSLFSHFIMFILIFCFRFRWMCTICAITFLNVINHLNAHIHHLQSKLTPSNTYTNSYRFKTRGFINTYT